MGQATSDTERAALVEALQEDASFSYCEKEIETSVGGFTYVAEEELDRRRWYTNIIEIYRAPSGKLFACPWERGHTESQENEYRPQDTYEVEPYDVVVTKYKKKT